MTTVANTEPLCYLVRFVSSHIINGGTLLSGQSVFDGDIYLIGREDMKLVESSGLQYRSVAVTDTDTTEAFRKISSPLTFHEISQKA